LLKQVAFSVKVHVICVISKRTSRHHSNHLFIYDSQNLPTNPDLNISS